MKSITLALASMLILAGNVASAECTDLQLGAKAVSFMVETLTQANPGSFSNTDESIEKAQTKILHDYRAGTSEIIVVLPMTVAKGRFNEVGKFYFDSKTCSVTLIDSSSLLNKDGTAWVK